jgi:6-phosphogluconolactonase (cycloisomerase 2 family)
MASCGLFYAFAAGFRALYLGYALLQHEPCFFACRGSFVVLTGGDGTVTSYAINDDGSLSRVGSAAAVANISNVVIDNSNKFVYVESPGTAQIFAYTFDAETGALGSVAGSPFTASGSLIRMMTAAPHQ